jgi:hypothetical protein
VTILRERFVPGFGMHGVYRGKQGWRRLPKTLVVSQAHQQVIKETGRFDATIYR